MNWKEFKELIFGLDIDLSNPGNRYMPVKTASAISRDSFLSEEWVTGGMEGGSYSGEEAVAFTSNEPEKEIEDLDKILMEICPNISYLQHRRLSRMVITRGTRTSGGDYYGNHCNYSTKTVQLGTLFDALIELNLLERKTEPRTKARKSR